jgi:hypothetical protein
MPGLAVTSIIVALILFFTSPLPARAAEVRMVGKVTAGVSGAPVRDVRVDVFTLNASKLNAALTDVQGQYEAKMEVTKPFDKPVSVELRFFKEGFEPYPHVSIQSCDFRSSACQISLIQLTPSGGSAALTEDERAKLEVVKSTEGSSLFMLPYQVVLPAASASPINMKALTDSLQIAIITQIQSLEGDRELSRFEPLEPVSLMAVPPGIDVDGANVEKIKIMGHYLNALAVISGNGELIRKSNASETIDMRSRFLIMPTKDTVVRQLVVEDREVPATLFNSLRLAENLSPQWGHHTLLALCQRELEKAKTKQVKDRDALWRVRAYVNAQLHRASGDEKLKVGDLQRLLQQIDKELLP